MRHLSNDFRVIAIAPFTKGFGFIVMERQERLIDWGLKIIRVEKNRESLKRVADLIKRYSPDSVVIEDYKHKGSHRSARVQTLLKDIESLSATKGVKTRRVPRFAFKSMVSRDTPSTKHQIAVEIVKQFPELAHRLPRKRKPWLNEDARMNIFIALGLALASASTVSNSDSRGSEYSSF